MTIKKETLDDLHAALDADKKKRQAAQAHRNEAEQKQAETATRWATLVQSVLKPSLDEILNILRQDDWSASVVDLPRGFKVTVNKAHMRVYHSGAAPFVSFVIDERTPLVTVRRGTPSEAGDASPPHGTHEVDNVTTDLVHQYIVGLVKELTK